MRSPADQRSSVARAEKVIAGDLLRASRATPELDAALSSVVEYLAANPDAGPDDAVTVLMPVLDRPVRSFIDRLYGVLAEDVPAAIDGVTR